MPRVRVSFLNLFISRKRRIVMGHRKRMLALSPDLCASAAGRVLLISLFFLLPLGAVSIANAQNCECIVCHGPNGPHSGGFPGCAACHGNPPLSNQPDEGGLVRFPGVTGATTAGAHRKHATPEGYNYGCQTCHFEGMPVTLIADNGEFQIGFNIFGQGGGAYDGRPLLSPYTYVPTNGTTITTNGSMACSSIYCHSNGTSVSTGLTPAGGSPSWGAGPVACNACHGYPPQYAQDQPKSNSHVVHMQQLQQTPGFSCGTCHYTTTADGSTISDYFSHVNMQYDVNPAPDVNFDYVYDRGGGRCLNITCHGGEHPGFSNVWGAVTLNVGISTSYPGCYQVSFIGSVTGGTGPYTFFWELGDDTTGSGSVVSHTYQGAGPYFPKLTVTDANNHVGTRTVQVNPVVANTFPVAAKSISAAGRTVTLTDLSYDTDYNLCGHSGPGSITIVWGDGTPAATQSLNLTDSPSNAVFTHTYTCSTTCTFTIQHSVKDNSNAGPVFSNNVQVTVPVPLSISGRVLHANGTPFSAVTMQLRSVTGNILRAQTTTDANGNYSFSNVNSNFCNYNLIPSRAGYTGTFSPTSIQDFCASMNNANFIGNP
jgi:predicted CxxxxCH...CXXCH cytochrome family protein